MFDTELSVKFMTGRFVMSHQAFKVDLPLLCHVICMPVERFQKSLKWATAFLARAQQLSLNLTTISEWCEFYCVM